MVIIFPDELNIGFILLHIQVIVICGTLLHAGELAQARLFEGSKASTDART